MITDVCLQLPLPQTLCWSLPKSTFSGARQRCRLFVGLSSLLFPRSYCTGYLKQTTAPCFPHRHPPMEAVSQDVWLPLRNWVYGQKHPLVYAWLHRGWPCVTLTEPLPTPVLQVYYFFFIWIMLKNLSPYMKFAPTLKFNTCSMFDQVTNNCVKSSRFQ